MTQSFARTPAFAVRVCACPVELRVFSPTTHRTETWTSPSSKRPRVRCSTGVRPSPAPWRRTLATAPTTWWPATAEARWCCRRSANSSSCVWCRSPCCACCLSPWCSAYSSSGATWWSSPRAWLTSWWRNGDLPKTWSPSWWDSARTGDPARGSGARTFTQRSLHVLIKDAPFVSGWGEKICKTSLFLPKNDYDKVVRRPMFVRKVRA